MEPAYTVSPINVVHAANSLGIGGTQKALELIVKNSSENFVSSVCGIRSGGKRGELLRENGFDVFVANGSSNSLLNYFKEKDPDILHLHGSGAGKAATEAAVSANIPIVVKSDNFGWTDNPSVAKKIDRYFFPSKMTLLRYFLLNKISIKDGWGQDYEVVHNPLTESMDEGFDLRQRYGISPETPLLGKIGRQAPEKWGRITISAFERVVNQIPEAKLVLVTPPEKIKQEVELREISENVIYIDKIPLGEVGGFYQNIDVLAHASAIGESFGYVIAEAMVNETPVVVNSTPLRDNAQIELVDNSETGYVANSSQAYADAIISLLQNETKRKNMGQRGRTEMLRRYGIKHVIETIEREYYDLMQQAGQYDGSVNRHRTDMESFQEEYQQRLDNNYGDPDVFYQIERTLWDFITSFLPVKRELAYRGAHKLVMNMNH